MREARGMCLSVGVGGSTKGVVICITIGAFLNGTDRESPPSTFRKCCKVRHK